jgi:hypothetical protein
MDTLKKYKITFAKVVKQNFTYLGVDSVNDWLSIIIQDHKTISEANRLLNGVNKAISENKQNPQWDFPTQGMVIAVVDAVNTKIYENLEEYAENKSIPASFTLPTLDFKNIVEKWIQYLQSNS